MSEKVLLGMSGGVDSSVAAIILKNKGYDVIGITLTLFCEKNKENKAAIEAKSVCDFLQIPHYEINFEDAFKKQVIDDFITQYKNCRTPNPCIECNKYLKFGLMYEKAKELGCQYIATGHYAKTEYSDEYKTYVIKKSNAGKKDQSYVLYNIDRTIIDKIIFPLGGFKNKDEIRKIANEYNIPTANKPDSEDICFVPNGDYKDFLEKNSDIKSVEGNIVDRNGNILGKHLGLYRYTIGQRKGLGISNKVPLFVVGFNKERNELIVDEEKGLYRNEFLVSDVNMLVPFELNKELDVNVKIRYLTNESKGKIIRENEFIKVITDEPQKAITPGQSAVFYIKDVVIGGGKII